MITLPEYLIKLSVSLAVLYVFYRIVLNRLTFYQWNRIYLLGYSLLSFVLPFINISPWIEQQGMEESTLTKIPALGNYALEPSGAGVSWPVTTWMAVLFLSGVVILLGRMLMSYWSLWRIRRNAVLCHTDDNIRLFNTDARINPFSFGRSIYLNKQLHSEGELQRIIQHEMVHVKQKHTIDLMLGELVAIVNWYNPFAWLIRHAIRQNLEFIADKNVLDKGFDKKAYQYLLLKVVGLQQYSIVNNFSLPHLKKRIIMMNKMKSASLHLTRFLFALPLLCIVLLAFRSEKIRIARKTQVVAAVPLIHRDTVPPQANASVSETRTATPERTAVQKGDKKYRLSLADNNGECVVIIKDGKQKIVKAMTLAAWNQDQARNEKKYGQIPPLPAKTITFRNMTTADLGHITLKSDDPSSARPLIVLNGEEQARSFDVNLIPPTEIQSITVLKGEEATKRYGEKGVNGVVEIKSKSRIIVLDGRSNMPDSKRGAVQLEGTKVIVVDGQPAETMVRGRKVIAVESLPTETIVQGRKVVAVESKPAKTTVVGKKVVVVEGQPKSTEQTDSIGVR